MVSTNADAQNAGYNRLQNVTTGHVAQLSGGLRFAPDVTLEQAYSKPGTVAYAEFDGQKVTQLRAQGVDVVNTIVPMMKGMLLQMIDPETFAALKDSALVRVDAVLSGAMGILLKNYINNYSYENFQEYVDNFDTNLYYTAVDGGYQLYINTPPIPFNAGDFNSYFTSKMNSFLTLYRGTFMEYAKTYLVGREYLTPVVNSFIKNLQFSDILYLREMNDETYGPYFGFSNSGDLKNATDVVWDFIPVDDTNYLGIEGTVKDADGKWWTSLSVDFAFRVPEGMKVYYVDSEVDYSKSLIHRVEVKDEVIPALTPVILQLNGEDAASNKLAIVDEYYTGNYADNQLRLPVDEFGFMLGFTLEEPDRHYCTLGITDGKVALKVTDQTEFGPNQPYYYLSNDLMTLLTSGSMTLADDVSGIDQMVADTPLDNQVYDLQGRRVENPTKGIYIVNGKKVLYK